MKDLENRLKALEVGAQYEATENEVKAVEEEFLGKLQEIKSTMLNETKAGGGAASSASSKEMEALKAENETLQKRNAKLEYRVKHMLMHMEELYNNQKQ